MLAHWNIVAGNPAMSMSLTNTTARRIPCEACPLRGNEHFRAVTSEKLKFVSGFKRSKLVAKPCSMMLAQGSNRVQKFTLVSGWASHEHSR